MLLELLHSLISSSTSIAPELQLLEVDELHVPLETHGGIGSGFEFIAYEQLLSEDD